MPAGIRLKEQLEKADELRQSGDFNGARSILDALKLDPEVAALGPRTSLGLPRKLHSAFLKLAKAEGDLIRRIGYQFHLVPPPDLLAPYATCTLQERRGITEANRQSVPPVIHQIWIGPQKPPVATEAWAAHARQHGYGYCLWREEDLRDAGIYDNATLQKMLKQQDFPGAVDIARYLILEQEGGIYLDCDWYPARSDISFHDLLPMTGLIALAEQTPRNMGRDGLLLANSFIAAPPHHPVLARLNRIVADMIARIPGAPAWWATGPFIFTLAARGGSITLADSAFVAASLRRGAPFDEVKTLRDAAEADDTGLLIAWKSW